MCVRARACVCVCEREREGGEGGREGGMERWKMDIAGHADMSGREKGVAVAAGALFVKGRWVKCVCHTSSPVYL